ncbi:hypothetical protein [Primorskyibacter flagellatus]|uniref:Uncharacterized protein n=1 Tax=Primorskyibacter flagellatus TaxID=1387277 RepID=A0A1W2DB61_9RHOB|nr:hypothetical protein [Primorskyibacter flagellatus]SMC94316.1 hypothetical protein SAMN06295998_11227 [Primorskyibacter flagellatus]
MRRRTWGTGWKLRKEDAVLEAGDIVTLVVGLPMITQRGTPL